MKRLMVLLVAAFALVACNNGDAPPTSQPSTPGAQTAPAPEANAALTGTAIKPADTVSVHVFNGEGELIGPVLTPRVEKADAVWQTQLTEQEYYVTRKQGTERAFTGKLLKNPLDGVYVCICCDLPLYSSSTKFDSGTGWPSFYEPIAATNVAEKSDTSHGMVRTEILCPRCDAHLGHVFNDGPPPTGKRHCVNSASLRFVTQGQLKMLDETDNTVDADAAATDSGDTASAVFAGGCFWCTEAVFEPLNGVKAVVSGYAGGTAQNAVYDVVSSGRTKHAEAIEITYDPAVISYDKLLEIFFTVAHDPTQLNKQGPDHGTQYRSAVFYADDQQKAAAEAMIKKLGESGKFDKPIVTTLEPLEKFYPAEKYHQDFVARNPRHGYVVINALPKVRKLKDKYGDELKK